MNAYALSAHIMQAVLREGETLTEALTRLPNDLPVSTKSRIHYLTHQGCRWYFKYLAVLDVMLDKPIKEKDADILALLIQALFELDDPEKAEHAVVSETVEAARQLKKDWATGLINGVLRRWQRESAELSNLLKQDSRFVTAHPGWLSKLLKKNWPDQFTSIIDANNQTGPMTLRINQQQVDPKIYLDRLNLEQIPAQLSSLSKDGIVLQNPVPVSQLPGFYEGHCSVQDEAAQLASLFLQARPDDHVLDACCAPGGKTCHLLELGVQDLQAVDISENRMTRVHENLSRLNLSCDTRVADLVMVDSWWNGRLFDRILLDAPCSATGVIRRHPDIKILRTRDDIRELNQIQKQILQTLWTLLKPGGLLLYATCSVLPEENQATIDGFLEQQSDAEPAALGQGHSESQLQLFPQPGSHDGFYYAKLRKVSEQA